MKIEKRFIRPQFWFILILESVFFLFTQRNNSLSAFHLVCVFMSLNVYFVKFYICISSCVRVLNVCTITEIIMENYTFSVITFFYESLPSGFKNKTRF